MADDSTGMDKLEERIEVTFDDSTEKHESTDPEATSTDSQPLIVELDADDSKSANSVAASAGLEITLDDLADDAQVLPSIQASMLTEKAPSKQSVSALANISARSVATTAVGGLCGGILGWLLTEPIQAGGAASMNIGGLVADAAAFAGLAGAAMGVCIAMANRISAGTLSTGARFVIMGVISGTIGGIAGGCLAQYVYGVLSLNYVITGTAQIMLRSVGWSIMGLFFGLGQSVLVANDKKMRNGIIGGALGGLIGGLAFQLLLDSVSNASLGRFLALCVVGLSIGLMLSLVEEATKEAWLRVVKGALSGKQFILYQERTVIGSSPMSDIPLFKDQAVAPEHAVVENHGSHFILSGLAGPGSVIVNGAPISRQMLEDGDKITVGSSTFEFRERASSGKGSVR